MANVPEMLKWWNHGDPPIWLELILKEVEGNQRQQIMNHYLEAVHANLQVQVKLVEGVRNIMAGKQSR